MTLRTKNKDAVMPALYEAGRVPPQAVDLEEAVLGACMLEKNALIIAVGILSPEMLYKEAHQVIYRAILELFRKGEPVDILTVNNQLRDSGLLEMVGGTYYIAQITNRVASSANVEYHSRIILEKFIQRELIRVSAELTRDAYDGAEDVFDMIDRAQQSLLQAGSVIEKKASVSISTAGMDALEKIEKIRKDESGGWGIKCGITIIDQLTRGFQPSDLIIIAARPGMGKTALMLTMARYIGIICGIPMAVFSMEMAVFQLVIRTFSQEVGLTYNQLIGGRFSDVDHARITEFTKKLPSTFIIDDTPALTIMELRSKCVRLVIQHGIKIVFIDYLQLMRGSNERGVNREQQISEISRGVKALAKELDIPIIAISQLSRNVEQRGGDKKPRLSDLRESGSIEQDADMVMFIFRPGYYMSDSDMIQNGVDETLAEIDVAKHRNGRTGVLETKFIKETMLFQDIYPDQEIDSSQAIDFTESDDKPF